MPDPTQFGLFDAPPPSARPSVPSCPRAFVPSTHHNTTHETKPVLGDLRQRAADQQDAILAVFRRWPDRSLTPDDIAANVNDRWPITSIRRAITNLTTAGYLIKTDRKKTGHYGRPCYCWRLAK